MEYNVIIKKHHVLFVHDELIEVEVVGVLAIVSRSISRLLREKIRLVSV
jgi:hypothetical protein